MMALLLIPFLAMAGGQAEEETAEAAEEVSVVGKGGIVYSTAAEYKQATGMTITKFSEAPMLKEMVDAGKLPPVEERLPEDVVIAKPFEKIGKYGGTLRLGDMTRTAVDAGSLRRRGLFWSYMSGSESVPNIAKGYQWSSDLKTMTIYLRKGHKWSDGQPFTTDDVMFFYEDVLTNKELTPILASRWSPEGKPVKFIRVDELTFKIQYEVPYPRIFDVFQRGTYGGQNFVYAPKHALMKYHIKYNKDVNEAAKKEGLENWVQLFGNHRRKGWLWDEDPEVPILAA